MGSVSVSILEGRKAEYEWKMASARDKLKSSEAEYNSLLEFKGKVQSAQEKFHGISNRESELLENIRPYRDKNKCAKIFDGTITDYLDSVGTKTVACAYNALIRMVSDQLSVIYNTIEDLNIKILKYRDAISDINAEIDYQKSTEV